MKSTTNTKGPHFFGCHVSASGGYEKALEHAETLGINTVQIHACPPQRWNRTPFVPGVETKFLERRPTSGVEKFFFHAIYLINLATPNPEFLQLSKQSLVHSLQLNERMNGNGVIVHVGSLKDTDEETGFVQIRAAISEILEKSNVSVPLLLEVAAGSGRVIGSKIEDLARIVSEIKEPSRIGFALDTQHLWASGYNLAEELDIIVNKVDSVLGLSRVHAIHLNDSKTALGSQKDRHENLGEGLIGRAALRNILQHPKLKEIPFILETPAMKDMDAAKGEVENLRAIIAE